MTKRKLRKPRWLHWPQWLGWPRCSGIAGAIGLGLVIYQICWVSDAELVMTRAWAFLIVCGGVTAVMLGVIFACIAFIMAKAAVEGKTEG